VGEAKAEEDPLVKKEGLGMMKGSHTTLTRLLSFLFFWFALAVWFGPWNMTWQMKLVIAVFLLMFSLLSAAFSFIQAYEVERHG